MCGLPRCSHKVAVNTIVVGLVAVFLVNLSIIVMKHCSSQTNILCLNKPNVPVGAEVLYVYCLLTGMLHANTCNLSFVIFWGESSERSYVTIMLGD